jgi:predicted amidophosphoribosyltransferase
MNTCPFCGVPFKADAKYCSHCGSPISNSEDNHCINPNCIKCKRNYVFNNNDLYCDKCGEPTALGTQDIKLT